MLIDFGLTKRIDSKLRLALAKMVVSAELLDYGGILDSHIVRSHFPCHGAPRVVRMMPSSFGGI